MSSVSTRGQATTELDSAMSTLSDPVCRSFRLDYPDGTTIGARLSPTPAPQVGETAWSATVAVDAASFRLSNQLVLVRVADRIAALSFSGPEGIDPTVMTVLSTLAAERLA